MDQSDGCAADARLPSGWLTIGPSVQVTSWLVTGGRILPESPLTTPHYRRLADAPDVAAGAEPAAR